VSVGETPKFSLEERFSSSASAVADALKKQSPDVNFQRRGKNPLRLPGADTQTIGVVLTSGNQKVVVRRSKPEVLVASQAGSNLSASVCRIRERLGARSEFRTPLSFFLAFR
jgi:hypothetical protein